MFKYVVRISLTIVLFGLYIMATTSLLSWMNIPNTPILIGCVVGVVVATALFAWLFGLVWRRRKKTPVKEQQAEA